MLGESLHSLTLNDLQTVVWSSESDQMRQVRSDRDRFREQLSEAQQECDRLQEQIQRFRSRQKMLTESGLPDYAVTDEFQQQLLEIDSDDGCRKLIRDRLALIQESRHRTPLSRLRRSEHSHNTSDQQIVSLIRNGRTVPQGRLVTH